MSDIAVLAAKTQKLLSKNKIQTDIVSRGKNAR